MAGRKKQPELTAEEKLQQALVPEAEQPYKVPDNWCWTRLKNISLHIADGSHNPPKDSGSGVPLLSATNIHDHFIDIENATRWITKEEWIDENKRTKIEKNDILLTIVATIGRTAVVKNEIFALQRSVAVIKPKINSEFLSYYFETPYIQKFMLDNARGTAQKGFYLNSLQELMITLPPLAEQQRIVERIESLFAKLDEAKENLQNVLDGFETCKAAILHKAFTGELTVNWRKQHGVTMDSWETKSLKDCSILITKGSSPRWQGFEYINDITQTLFITSENVREGFLDLTKRKYLDNKINEIQKRSILKKGDVLVNIVGASIGRSAIFEFDCLANTNQAVCIVRTNKLLYNRFLCFFLNSPRALVYYDSNKVETARANISLTDIANIQISIPSISEQTEIVRIIDELLAKEQRVKEIAEDALAKIDLIKKSILARAFRGELGTNNLADEPAVELLKRVL